MTTDNKEKLQQGLAQLPGVGGTDKEEKPSTGVEALQVGEGRVVDFPSGEGPSGEGQLIPMLLRLPEGAEPVLLVVAFLSKDGDAISALFSMPPRIDMEPPSEEKAMLLSTAVSAMRGLIESVKPYESYKKKEDE